MKKLILVIVFAIMLTSLQVPVLAANEVITVLVDGTKVKFDAQPYTENGRTMVPISIIALALKFNVKWLPNENAAQISKGSNVLKFVLDTNILYINGEKKLLDVKTVNKYNRTYVPLAYLAQYLNCSVDWIGSRKMVLVNSYIADGPKLLLDRILQTGDYEKCQAPFEGYYKPKDQKAKFRLSKASKSSTENGKIQKQDLLITIYEQDEYTRKKVKELLAICYPGKYETAYMFLIVVMRGEAFEYENEFSVNPGITNCMLDNRGFSSTYYEGDMSFSVAVGYPGYDMSKPDYWYMFRIDPKYYERYINDYFINKYNINEYTVNDYNKVRKVEWDEEGIKSITMFGATTYVRE